MTEERIKRIADHLDFAMQAQGNVNCNRDLWRQTTTPLMAKSNE